MESPQYVLCEASVVEGAGGSNEGGPISFFSFLEDLFSFDCRVFFDLPTLPLRDVDTLVRDLPFLRLAESVKPSIKRMNKRMRVKVCFIILY